MRTSVSNVVVLVNSSDSSRFLDFDILVEDIWRQVLAPHLTIRSDHNLVDLEGFGEGPKFWQFLSYFLNFGTTRIWSWTLLSLSIFGTTESKSHASNLDDDIPTWSLKDHVGTLCLRKISVRSKSKCIKKSIKHRYFVHLFRFPAKKAWKCEKNTIFGKWYHVGTFAI